MRKCSVIYQDKFGTEKSDLQTIGSEIRIKLKGIDFEGGCFESLEGKSDKEKIEALNSKI